VVPEPKASDDRDDRGDGDGGNKKPPTHRSGYRPWAELLKRSFQIELRCSRCGAPMKLKAFLTSPASLRRLLCRLGEPTEPPTRAPARGPPYFATQVVRRALGGAAAQVQMFDGA
jgi:hypothetical protein